MRGSRFQRRAAFGMGLYVDHYSRDVESRGNTVISTSITGINYGRSTGQIVNNTVYNASCGAEYAAHISLGSESKATVSGNVLYGLGARAWTLRDLGNFPRITTGPMKRGARQSVLPDGFGTILVPGHADLHCLDGQPGSQYKGETVANLPTFRWSVAYPGNLALVRAKC